MLLTELINYTKNQYGEYSCLHFKGKEYSNLEVERLSKKISFLLRKNGIADGERVVVCMPNCPEVIFSYQGILRARNIVVPVLLLLHPNEIHYILNDCQAKAIITSSFLLPNLIQAAKGLPYKPIFIVADQVESSPSEIDGFPIMHLYEEIQSIDDSEEVLTPGNENDVAVILYTSGTTGKPKGVMLTHKNLYSSAKTSYEYVMKQQERGNTLCVLPLAHVFGFTAMNASFLLGSSIVILPTFDVDEVFECIEKYKISAFGAVPAMIYAMVHSPNADKYDLSSLEFIISGSAPLPLAVIEAFEKKFSAEIREGYGLSEAAPVVSAHQDGMTVKHGSVGKPIPGIEVKIVDENGDEVPQGEIGELIVKGDNVSPGYYRLEEETKKTIKDGWLRTGDLVRMDEDGYLYIVDRKKDLIIRGGLNIYPRDVEEVIAKHDGVAEVAVIGVPDERMGEEIVACVVKKPNATVSEEELIHYSQQKLAKYKTPRKIVFLKQLPRNGVGKVLKRNLRETCETIQ